MAFNMTGADFDRTRLVINSDAQAIPAGSHPGRYNKPTGFKEVSVLMASEPGFKRDIQVRVTESGQLHDINEAHRAFDALHYTTLFPLGEDSWNLSMTQYNSQKKVSVRAFYAYHLNTRSLQMQRDCLFRSERLFQVRITELI